MQYTNYPIDYALVAGKAICLDSGQIIQKPDTEDVEGCAHACKDETQMFIYGTNQYGNNKCDNGKCQCWCEVDTKDFKCKNQAEHSGYDLYTFKGKGITFKIFFPYFIVFLFLLQFQVVSLSRNDR